MPTPANIRTIRFVPQADPVAAVEKQAAKDWGFGSPQYWWHLAFAAHRCPECDGPLVSKADSSFRRCEKCRLSWFAQFSEQEGSAKPGSLIACFRFE